MYLGVVPCPRGPNGGSDHLLGGGIGWPGQSAEGGEGGLLDIGQG